MSVYYSEVKYTREKLKLSFNIIGIVKSKKKYHITTNSHYRFRKHKNQKKASSKVYFYIINYFYCLLSQKRFDSFHCNQHFLLL
jgi:hypothetical protein